MASQVQYTGFYLYWRILYVIDPGMSTWTLSVLIKWLPMPWNTRKLYIFCRVGQHNFEFKFWVVKFDHRHLQVITSFRHTMIKLLSSEICIYLKFYIWLMLYLFCVVLKPIWSAQSNTGTSHPHFALYFTAVVPQNMCWNLQYIY